jgi:hypothetical protein
MDNSPYTSGRHGHVYFGLDDRYLLEYCGHYLNYGSEYLLCFSAFLAKQIGYDLKEELGKLGMPTIFEVNMPIKRFQSAEIEQPAEDALSAWAYCIAHEKSEPGKLDFSIDICNSLPPENIVKHYHP